MTTVFYPYIEGSLYKKGNGIISSVWSYRHFELDIHEQTLRWYKVNPTSSSPENRVYRGSISVQFAIAEILDDKHKKNTKKKKAKKGSKHLTGEIFVVKYYPSLSRPATVATANPEDLNVDLSGPSGSPQEMYLSAPCLQEAYHWINHFNISSKIHLKSKTPPPSSKPQGDLSCTAAGVAAAVPLSTSPNPSLYRSATASFSIYFWLVIYLLPLVVFLFPVPYQLYIALGFVYSTLTFLYLLQHQLNQQTVIEEKLKVP